MRYDKKDPKKRITVEEALRSDFVAPVRRAESEVGATQGCEVANLHGNDGISVRVRRPGVSGERAADSATTHLQRGVAVQVGMEEETER